MGAAFGPVAGDVVFKHKALAGLHFTGSTGVFRNLWKEIGNNIENYRTYPRIVGETGGKDFIMVHKSAVAAEVATAMSRGAFEFQGQKCSAASRAYIPQNLWADVKRILWGPERPGDEYLTDRIGRQAVEFIAKNKSNPFFMYVGFNAPHSPMQAKKEHKQMVSHLQHEALQYYAAMLFSMDENVGKILKELDKQKLAENTLIIFLSDNGPTYAYNVDWPVTWPKVLIGSAGNLSGHKGQLLEGGIRREQSPGKHANGPQSLKVPAGKPDHRGSNRQNT